MTETPSETDPAFVDRYVAVVLHRYMRGTCEFRETQSELAKTISMIVAGDESARPHMQALIDGDDHVEGS